MSIGELFAKLQSNFWKMGEAEKELLVDIQERLLMGQKKYGGFNFEKYDLGQMALEELEDYIVYTVAKKYLEKRRERKGS